MRDFVINEISAVDSPSMEHARMAIMKRADPDNSQEPNHMQKIMTRETQPISFDTLQEAMQYLQRNGMGRTDAMSKAAREHPDLLKAYNAEGETRVHKALDTSLTIMTRPPAVRQFQDLIREIKTRDGCDSVTALRRAKAEDPELFARYQAA
ncbi:MAG: hypothetical protein HYW28_01115 [Rhodospirillales bacterium]|nr:hypothetical protein [Rhodospirillales bacterium]